jgi:hypothetical protein
MPTRDHERRQRSDAMNPAARAFLSLSDDGTAELDSSSTRKSAAALAIMFLVLLAAPLYWVSHSQAHATDQTLAVKHDDGGNSGPGGGDDDDDDHGDDDGNNDNPNATHQGNTGPGASDHGGVNDDNGDDNPNATHQGNTGPGASEHGGHHPGHGNGGSDDDAHHTVNANETQGTVGTTLGDG